MPRDLRASPMVLSMYPEKIFLTSKFKSFTFSNPAHKTKTGTANRWEYTSSKPPGPIIMIGQSETGSSNHIIVIKLFSGRY